MHEDPFADAYDRSHDNPDVPRRVQEVILERKVIGKPHFGLLIGVFLAAFAFVGIVFALDPGGDKWWFNWFIATPCMIASLAASLTFMKLIMGTITNFKTVDRMLWLAVALFICKTGGIDKLLILAAIIAAGVLCSNLFLRFVVGEFIPVVRVSKQT